MLIKQSACKTFLEHYYLINNFDLDGDWDYDLAIAILENPVEEQNKNIQSADHALYYIILLFVILQIRTYFWLSLSKIYQALSKDL